MGAYILPFAAQAFHLHFIDNSLRMGRLYGRESYADGGGLVVTERDAIERIYVALLVGVEC